MCTCTCVCVCARVHVCGWIRWSSGALSKQGAQERQDSHVGSSDMLKGYDQTGKDRLATAETLRAKKQAGPLTFFTE